MKRYLGWLIGLLCCTSPAFGGESYTDYVNPFIGTATVGHTYPGATLPFAMVQVGPDTGTQGWEYCAGYHDADSSIIGFSHTHLSGTGCPDMGDILLMPITGEPCFEAGSKENPDSGYRSRFDHANETARPGYYSVRLDDYDIFAEMTLTPRTAFHRYAYPDQSQSGVILDLGHGIGDETMQSSIRQIDDRTLVGVRHSAGFVKDHQYYFCIRFSRPIEEIVSYCDGTVGEKTEIAGKICKMYVGFGEAESKPLSVKVALSTASEEGARRNMEAEIPHWNFNKVKKAADRVWNENLAMMQIDPVDDNQLVSFYTALYHSLIMPNLVTDVDGTYSGWDHKIHQSTEGDLYTNYSLWDTYRALHPLYTILIPARNEEFIHSMLQRYRQVGALPTNEYGLCETYAMIGNHAIPRHCRRLPERSPFVRSRRGLPGDQGCFDD